MRGSSGRTVAGLGGRCLSAAPLLAVLGCAPAATTPAPVPVLSPPALSAEMLEYANISPGNRIPKSTGKVLVAAFERFCLGKSRDRSSVVAALRSADYVAAPRLQDKGRDGGMTDFVVDDRRPMVTLSDNGRFCAVTAEARSGQQVRIDQMMARRFPGAKPVKKAETDAEFTYQVSTPRKALIALRRNVALSLRSRLVLGIRYTG